MNKAEISAAGFAAIRRSPRRIIANIQSIKKSEGKTRLALTGKKPVGYISVEIGGEEGVADGFIPRDADSLEDIQIAKIRMKTPEYPNPSDFGTSKEDLKRYDEAVNAAVQAAAEPAMADFYTAYYASLANMETTVIDTGTDLYALARLANFGRLEKVPQLAYTQVKREFAKLFDDAYSSSGSVLWLHHMRDKGEVVDKKWQATGVYETDGCSVVTDKVQAVIQLWREDLTESNETTGRMVKFCAQIVDSRHNADCMGSILHDDSVTMAELGNLIIPTSVKQDWE